MIITLIPENLTDEGRELLAASPENGIHNITRDHIYSGLKQTTEMAQGVIVLFGFNYAILKAGQWLVTPLVKDVIGLSTTIVGIASAEKIMGAMFAEPPGPEPQPEAHHHSGARGNHER
jgi:hypothetical protein